MEPEKPPRRRKSGETPMTIDLEAVPASDDAKAPPAGPAKDPDAAVATGVPDTEPKPAEPTSIAPETAEQPTAEQPTVEQTPLGAADEPVPAAAIGPDPAEAPAREETSAEPGAGQPFTDQPQTPPRTQTEQRPSKSGALAAAIVGGLVALAGAGALQYGGYLPTLGPGGGSGGDLAPLSAELDALKARVDTLGTSASSPAVDLEPLESRLAVLERTAAAPAAGAVDEEAQRAIATLEATVAKLTADITALRDRIAAAERAVSDQSAQLTQRIDAAEQKLAEPRDDVAMARAVAATALKTAIDRGGPYLAELEAYVSVSPDDPAVAPLRAHAPTGVVSRADLVRQFEPVADDMIEAVHRPAGEQGIVDRLLASASSVITVRPVGSVEGDSPEAIVARIENKLQNGDLKGAQIEWQALPEAARNAGAAFKAELDQRILVEDGVGAIVSGAMAKSGNQG